ATTNWQFAPLFKKRYPRINLLSREIFTEDQGLFCTGGATAPFTLGLALVERHATPKLASLTAKALQVKPTRRVSPGEKGHGDPDILAAQAHMETHFARPLNMAGLAKRIGLSPRHFKRRFRRATGHNPLTYLQKIRVEAAKQRLETSQDSINDITWQIGYEDSSSFRRLFKRHTRLSPREYRDRFMDQLDQGELVPQ
ncbi:MAG: helix-turn-helix domain-containing protein, partial [Desulfovibrionales bacterium]|nr:helix-turn-helix domain-containing protein [Desulfovibrionales bacterium]